MSIYSECRALAPPQCAACDDTGRLVHCHDPDCQESNACHHVGGESPCPECGPMDGPVQVVSQ